ncbi:hypothetical protein C8J57DRAFT_1728500 [Mycena rebaudengoi]|nr:hypothetical protein C8J57DRAFT_1728500 [Mycena rebaudengoi]
MSRGSAPNPKYCGCFFVITSYIRAGSELRPVPSLLWLRSLVIASDSFANVLPHITAPVLGNLEMKYGNSPSSFPIPIIDPRRFGLVDAFLGRSACALRHFVIRMPVNQTETEQAIQLLHTIPSLSTLSIHVHRHFHMMALTEISEQLAIPTFLPQLSGIFLRIGSPIFVDVFELEFLAPILSLCEAPPSGGLARLARFTLDVSSNPDS